MDRCVVSQTGAPEGHAGTPWISFINNFKKKVSSPKKFPLVTPLPPSPPPSSPTQVAARTVWGLKNKLLPQSKAESLCQEHFGTQKTALVRNAQSRLRVLGLPLLIPELFTDPNPWKCTAATTMSRVSPVIQKGIPRLNWRKQSSCGAGSRGMRWWLLLFRAPQSDGPQRWPRQGPMPRTNRRQQCPGKKVQGTVPCAERAGSGTDTGASHRNCQAKHGRAANPSDLFWTTDLSWKYRCARIFCDQQPKEFRICLSLR